MALTVGELVAFLRLDKDKYDRGLRDARGDADRAGADIGRSLSIDLDRDGRLERYAQRIRDLRTLYGASLKPIRDYATQVARVAVVGGAAATALGGGVGLLGVASALVFALGQVGGALPLVGTGLLGVAAVATTAKVGLLGVADALEDRVGDAFDKISPKADRFLDRVETLIPALVRIKDAIQDDLFSGLDAFLGPLATRYLPILERSGGLIAAALNDAAANTARGLLDPRTSAALREVLGEVAGVLEDLSPQLRTLIPLFAQLLAAGTPVLERLGERFGRMLETWQAKLREAIRSGTATDVIDTGVSNAAAFLGTLANVAASLYHVGRAAQETFGVGVPGALEKGTGAVREWLASAEGQRTITGVFRGFLPVLRGIGDLAKLLGPELLTLVPVIRDLALALIAGLKPVIPVAGELARALGEALIAVLPAVSRLAVALGGFLADALETLAPAIGPLADAIATLLAPTGLLSAVLEALAPVLVPLAAGLARVVAILALGFVDVVNALAPTLPALVDAIVGLAVAVAGSLAAALSQVAPLLPQLVTSFTELLVALIPLLPTLLPLIPVLVQLVIDAGIPLLNLLIDLAPGVVELARVLVQWAAVAAAILGPILGFTIGVIHGFAAWLGRGGIGDVITRVAAWIVGLPGRISGVPGQMLRAGLSIIGGLLSGVSGRWGAVAAWFGRLAPNIRAAVGDLGGLLLEAGRSVIRGFIAGIREAIPGVGEVLSGLTSRIPDWKGPRERDRRLLDPAGRLVIRGLVAGIEAEVPSLRATLADVTRLIPADAGALSVQANRDAGAALAGRGRLGDATAPAGPPVVELGDVHVWIGETELTDLVDVRVETAQRATTGGARAGTGRRGY